MTQRTTPKKTDTLKKATQGAERFRAFTVKSKGRLNNICLEVGIVEHSEIERQSAATINTYRGRIDTLGALSCVSSKLVNDLSLIPQQKEDGLYVLLDFYLPNMIRIAKVLARIEEINSKPECDCLIGMDILSCGDLTLSNKDGETQFSFRVPAIGGEDFVQTHRKLYKNKTVVTAAARNSPCPCGSGKRYKNCCGKFD
ncbi:MAG: SEC-C metal-binding domain-containing protein [Candidatus Oxydemutatoraceae bacterium WSBS_2016_MAG_OTU14]